MAATLTTIMPASPLAGMIATRSAPRTARTPTTETSAALSPDQAWNSGAGADGAIRWVANVDARLNTARIGGHVVPVTVLSGSPSRSSYVGSPHAAWISYPVAEALDRFAGCKRACATLALNSLAMPFVAAQMVGRLGRAAVIANHLVSTNLHPAWTAADIATATPDLTARFPDRPLLLRNICPAVDPTLADSLTAAGWRLIPARRIYLADPREPALWKHNHLKRDVKLLGQSDVELIGPEDLPADDLPAMRAVFRQLFIAKHSALNPDYTDAFFRLCHERRFLDLYALRLDGRPVGVLGVYERNGWVTTPLIGYDTSLPQELGLYRRLMALLFREAKRRDCRLHLSSGASGFKAARGGVAHLEYTAVHARHLAVPRRAAITAFAAAMDRAVPWVLERAEKA